MSSATSNRPSGAMTNAARSTHFPSFAAAAGRQNSDERSSQSSTLGQTFGNGGAWQATGGIWGNSTIGSGFTNSKRDASRSRVPDDEFPDGPSGSGALAASSEADPWSARPNPWNPDTTSPTMTSSHSGSTSPSHTRNSIPTNSSQQTLLEIQNQYQQPRQGQAIGQGVGLTRPQPKSSLDPSTGSFFARKPSFGFAENDKENSGPFHSNGEAYESELPSRFLGVGSVSRDGSMPPSRTSDAGHNGQSLVFGNGPLNFGSFGHTPSSSIHSQRQSISDAPGSFLNGPRYEISQNEASLNEKFANFNLSREQDHGNTSQAQSNQAPSYSPNNPNFPQNYQTNAQVIWNDAPKQFNNEQSASQPFADQGYFSKNNRFGDRGSVSPASSDYRRGMNSPKYYSGAGTPPVASDQIYRPGSRGPRVPQGPTDLDRRLQNMHLAQQVYMYNSHFPGQYQLPYDYPPQAFRQAYYPMPMPSYPPPHVVPTRPAKDQDIGHGVRSPLLDEFRGNSKSSKRYELKDIYNHIVEFSGDQHGSRFIQQKLETANSDEKEQLFREIQPNALQLMTDVFGNYVIQKIFEHGNQVQKRVLAEHMKNHVMELSMQMYGCRVVQKALEHVLADQQAELVKELEPEILKCVKDQNGNHVVQKAIERVPTDHIRFVIDAFRGQVHVLATHAYGCRVIQRILEFCKPKDHASILEELHQCASMLITDQYGNYVTQHLIQHGKPEDREKIIAIVNTQLLTLSKHKFASNVVEKSIQFGSDGQRQFVLSQVTTMNADGSNPLQLMMKDQYGNYVIQKLLAVLKGSDYDGLLEKVKAQLIELRKFHFGNFGKQITAMEKVIYGSAASHNVNQQSSTPQSQTMPLEINSSAPTPSLTNGQNSPQSSSLPSTNVSTIDDPNDSTASDQTAVDISGKEKTCPEVVINGI